MSRMSRARKPTERIVKRNTEPIVVTVGDIVDSRAAWAKIFNGSPPYNLGLPLALLLRQEIKPIWEEYNKTRGELLEEYGKRDEESPGSFHFLNDDGKVDREAFDAFADAIDDVRQAEIDIDFSVSLKLIMEQCKVALSPEEISLCAWLLEETRVEFEPGQGEDHESEDEDEEQDDEDEEEEDE
jgi:hypothetical protein